MQINSIDTLSVTRFTQIRLNFLVHIVPSCFVIWKGSYEVGEVINKMGYKVNMYENDFYANQLHRYFERDEVHTKAAVGQLSTMMTLTP